MRTAVLPTEMQCDYPKKGDLDRPGKQSSRLANMFKGKLQRSEGMCDGRGGPGTGS